MSLPFSNKQAVWIARATSQTVQLQSEFILCNVVVFEIATTGFSGKIDFKGKMHEGSTFDNIPYIREDQASVQVPSVSQLSFATDTARYRYVALGFWGALQVVMTRTAGTITMSVVGANVAGHFPIITALAAGAAVIGKVGHNITGIGDGRKVVTTAATRVTLASSTTAKVVIITAETDNTDYIVVGGSTVVAALATRKGTPLNPGDSVTLEVDDLADVYLDAMVSGEGCTFTYLT